MSQLLYYEFRMNRPNRQYHVNYSSTYSSIQSKTLSKFKQATIDIWKTVTNSNGLTVLLADSINEIPDNIGKISEDGFELDLKKMEPNKKYSLSYDDSIYEVFKNEKNELVI